MKHLFFLAFPFFFLACNSRSNEKKALGTNGPAVSVPIRQKVNDLEPGLAKADSLQVIYYDHPNGDSLRYTRFFSYTETADTTQIKILLREMDQTYSQEPKARQCRSEGKLYLLNGEAVLKTVYFSVRGDSCRYFYMIRDGAFIYFPVSKKAEDFLKESKKKARKPENTDGAGDRTTYS